MTFWERAAQIPYEHQLRQLMSTLFRDVRDVALSVYAGEFDRMFERASNIFTVGEWSWDPPELTRHGRPLSAHIAQEVEKYFANPSIVTAGEALSLPELRSVQFTMKPVPSVGFVTSIFCTLTGDNLGQTRAHKEVEKQHLFTEKARLMDRLNNIHIPRVEFRINQVCDEFIAVERKLCEEYAREAEKRLAHERRLLARFRRTFQTGDEPTEG